MAETPKHEPGTFCWAELASSDQEAARSFYTALFGWEAEEVPMSEDSTYTMFHIGGRYTAALYQADPKQPNSGPDCWGAYVAVDSVDEATERAQALGGLVLAGPFDVFDSGRMSVIQDPAGALFYMWQAVNHHGVGLKSEHGALCWNELLTHDTEASKSFYEGLFGWTAHDSALAPDPRQETPSPAGMYTSFLLGEFPAGGMLQIRPEWGEVPPHWATYFSVDDCDLAVARAIELGASPLRPAMDIPGVGRFAWLSDPQGATFAVITLAHR